MRIYESRSPRVVAVLRLLLCLLGLAAAGCGEGQSPAPPPATSQVCTPGRTQSCSCSSGARGDRVCREDGKWQACSCGTNPSLEPGVRQPIGSSCSQDSECSNGVCDPVRDKCVRCYSNQHCSGMRGVCYRYDCVECNDDEDCPGRRPACVQRTCVECTQDFQCEATGYCSGGGLYGLL